MPRKGYFKREMRFPTSREGLQNVKWASRCLGKHKTNQKVSSEVSGGISQIIVEPLIQ